MKKYINNKLQVLILAFLIISLPLFSGCGSSTQGSAYKVNLEVWGIFDESSAYTEAIKEYRKINPYIKDVNYRKFSQDTYKKELLEALASGQGPDIFLINNSWVPSFENKIEPAPEMIISEKLMQDNFPDIVLGDFVVDSKIYGTPLSVDSLALYYNKDIFNAAGITSPPKTWQEFDSDILTLTTIDSVGNIVRSGAAIGTAQNINRAPDILSMLMTQKGVQFPYKKGVNLIFSQSSLDANSDKSLGGSNAGERALEYYTNFAKLSSSADTANQLYTWNVNKGDSIEEFAKGSVAMMFNYSWNYNKIKDKNPKLNFSVALVPQENPNKPSTYGNYWGYVVSRNKIAADVPTAQQKTTMPISNGMRTHEAWQFLKFLTLKNSGAITLYNAVTKKSAIRPVGIDPAVEYIKKTNQPAARRDIIETQKSDPFLGTFAMGNLIAKHWYQYDPDEIDKIIADMISSVNRGEMDFDRALESAKNRINNSAKIN